MLALLQKGLPAENCIGRAELGVLAAVSPEAENTQVPDRRRFLIQLAAALSVAAAVRFQSGGQSRVVQRPAEGRVDINHASLEDLMKVPGITRSWAGLIVRFRPYRAKNDLLDRGVVPSAVYDRIKDAIVDHRNGQ
jgi:DNA uptake protein ComE-like DNA-binding protein